MSNHRSNSNRQRNAENANMVNAWAMNDEEDSKSTVSTVPNLNVAQRNADVDEMIHPLMGESIPANATPTQGGRRSRRSRRSRGTHRKGRKGRSSRRSSSRRSSSRRRY